MRKAWLLLLVAPSVLVWACGGGGDDSDAGGNNDAQADNTTKTDSGGIETSTIDSSSTDAGSNPDVVAVACHFPGDCVNGNEADAAYPPAEAGVVCCGKLVLSGTPPECNFDSFTSKCQAPTACNSDIQLACTTNTVRGCAHTSECVESNYNHCCTVAAFGDASVCMSQQIATQINAKCLP